MIKAWRVRLEVGRDDGEMLEDEALEALSSALAGRSAGTDPHQTAPARNLGIGLGSAKTHHPTPALKAQ